MLHLHPLTLEDILQQEPREKLELFPMLGYYFIVFRAVEYSTPQGLLDGASLTSGLSQLGVANEICIYLVVFRDGICTVSCGRASTDTTLTDNIIVPFFKHLW